MKIRSFILSFSLSHRSPSETWINNDLYLSQVESLQMRQSYYSRTCLQGSHLLSRIQGNFGVKTISSAVFEEYIQIIPSAKILTNRSYYSFILKLRVNWWWPAKLNLHLTNLITSLALAYSSHLMLNKESRCLSNKSLPKSIDVQKRARSYSV